VLGVRFFALISTRNHCDRVFLVLRLDQCLPCSKQPVEVFDRDSALELTAERGLDPHGIGKPVFSADRASGEIKSSP
jgi:hypothetical protein